ncbi:hypothetical protein CLV84_1701 [Neolewinella xylanilytica]|uniref:AAA domain-containing protein n=1 Tax=Neolewinella xylanilytica TaxID=1514080 RepID=A0A2S6IB48_9BACT|nr:hypothetical protein [Neolewinella xylanilytica]PPK88730.1 hypothetical protein CLV84_1701 [Neolewinella xylanilytica]
MIADLPASFSTAAELVIQRLDPEHPVHEMAANARKLAQAMIERGDACPAGEDADPTDLECRLIHFEWAERAKHFLLLYRDVQLQLQIASLMVRENKAEAATVNDLYRRSREALRAALEEWETDHGTRLDALQRNDRNRKKQLRAWKLQHNPWPLYRHQLDKIAGQSESLAEEYDRLTNQSDHLAKVRELVEEAIAGSRATLEQSKERANEIVRFIKQEDATPERPGVIAAKMEDYVAEDPGATRLDRYTNAITAGLARLSEQQRVTVASEQGILRFKEINFRRATDQWVSAQIMPLLYEMWELSAQMRNGLNVATANVRNRTILLASEIKAGNEVDFDNHQLAQPLATYLEKTTELQAEYQALRQRVEHLIYTDLELASAYRSVPGFLPLPLQRGINAFTRKQGRVLGQVGEWFGKYASGLNRRIGEATREEKLSLAEKTVRVVRQRTLSAQNSSYTNILITRGYIGESFLVGRDKETDHLRELVENWQFGYRGAVALTGERLAGKTLFGELVTNRFFPDDTIRLQPHATVTVQGRRTKTTGDLEAALSFVQKYTLQSRPLVWIDDLETWTDKATTFAANVRAMGRHIDDYSGRIFYLVSTSNAVYNHLSRYLDIDRVFQSEINLDNFSLPDMEQAVRIRHGATHKLLVDEDGEILSDAHFAKLVRRIYRATDGNVGDTINRWAYYTRRFDDDRVYQPRERRYALPGFLSPDTATLLSTILLEKRTRDYRLRKLFGPAYQERYASILQRLIRIGLVTRIADGSLEITESVVNDVGRQLEAEAYLTYTR